MKKKPRSSNPQQKIIAKEGSVISNVTQVMGDLYSRSQLEELNDHLARAVSTFEARMYRYLVPPAPPSQPYKILYAFGIEDANLFFGRERATQQLFEKVLNNRLTIFHAKSGAGKTSLLKAGVSPRLINAGLLPVHIHTHPYEEDFTPAVKRAIAPPRGPQPELLATLSLYEFLGVVCTHLKRETQGLVVIFDQFEEFLVSLPGPEVRLPFKKVLTECYEDPTLPIRFVISLHEDAVEDLDEFRDFIPHILQNQYQLPPMTQMELKEAITKPLEQLRKKVRFQPALLDTLLMDLGGAEAELPHLQIVCTRLYDSLSVEAEEITLASYQNLGGTEKILTTYLNDRLSQLPSQKRSMARNLLRELTSSRATSRILNPTALAEQLPPDPTLVKDVLEDLVEASLLRREDVAGVEEYELAHAFLAKEIITWVDQDELKVKEAQELLRQEIVSHRVHTTKVDGDRLNILRTYIKRLALDNEAQTLLFDSALARDHDVSFWLDQFEEFEQKEAAIKQIAECFKNRSRHQKLIHDLKFNLAPSLRKPLLLALQEVFNTAKRTEKRNVAKALWALRAWLPQQEWLPIIGILGPEWVAMSLGVGIALVLLFSGGFAGWKWLSKEQAVPGQWVTIAAGEFTMGSNEEEAKFAEILCLGGKISNKDECPTPEESAQWSGRQVKASLPEFAIMDNEVTNAQYKQCLNGQNDQKCQARTGWGYDVSDVNKPVTSLNWTEAMTYCKWLGGRLPTEGEWEKAARGPNGNRFPWGNEWDSAKANIEHRDTGNVKVITTYAKSDISDYGIKNMAGNVREWTASQFNPLVLNGEFANEALMPVNIDKNKPVVIRGGSWQNERSYALVFRRGADSILTRKPEIGFRCVCPTGQTCQGPWDWKWIWLGNY